METIEGIKVESVMRVVSGAVIRVNDGVKRLLLAQRRAGGSFPLRWCTPGGKAETGEGDIAALERELCEELRLGAEQANGLRWDAFYSHDGTSTTTGQPYHLSCYIATVSPVALAGLSPGDGIVGLGWFTADEVAVLSLAPADTANRAMLVEVLR